MLEILRNQSVDIVVGSRFVPGGNLGNFSLCRRSISASARRLSRLVLKADLNDPMSGFFMLRRDFFHETMRHLTNTGFEILLDLLVSSPRPVRIVELPFRFGHRVYGQSKLDEAVILEYLKLIADKLFGHVVPVAFVIFLLVWTIGLVVHLAVLKILYQQAGMNFMWAQTAATFIVITGSFFFNNRITYYDQRLRGRDLLRGFFRFCSVCTVGAVANISVAKMLYGHDVGWLMSGLLGAILGSVWNYGVATTFFNWHRRK
jgi:dolichol-phosphate mannosyltransferase